MTPDALWDSPPAKRGRRAAEEACAGLLSAQPVSSVPTVYRSAALMSLLARPDITAWPEWFREWLYERCMDCRAQPSGMRARLGLKE